MAQDYTITQVSAQAPREWGEGSMKTYYIKVKLEGHDRPVSIGKKAPDALHVGDTVYGTIANDPSHDEDKFKSEQKPNYGASTPPTSKPAYTPRDDLAIRAQWAIGKSVELKIAEGGDGDAIEETAQWLFAMVDRVKKGSSSLPAPKAEVDEAVAADIDMFTKEEGPF